MNTNVTVSVRSLLLAALLAVGLLAAYLLGAVGGGGTPAQAADETGTPAPTQPILTMTGTGKATAVPDQLSFGLTVTLTRDDLDTALTDASRTMTGVLDVLGDHGVDRADVQTTGLSMNPVYDYPEYGPPTLRGYQVTQRATVHVDRLADGGAAVSAAVAGGGNDVRVGNIRLLVGDTDAVMEQARKAAVQEAQAKAEQYAEASGQELGDVVTLREVRTKPLPTPVVPAALRATDDLAAVPIRAGKDETAVTVRVVWALE